MAHGRRHLPYAGGLMDQPEWLMQDFITLDWLLALIQKAEENDNGTQ